MRNFIQTITVFILGTCISCSNSSESVKAKLPAPKAMEARALNYVNNMAAQRDDALLVENSALGSTDAVRAAKSQIAGVSLFKEQMGSGAIRYSLSLVETFANGCSRSVYTSDTVATDHYKEWVEIDRGDFVIKCLDKSCHYLLFVVDRFSGGDLADVDLRSVRYQAGALILHPNPNNKSGSEYVPMFTEDEKLNDSKFLQANDHNYRKAVCTENTKRSFESDPVNPFELTDEEENENQNNYNELPNSNTFIGGTR